MKKFLFAGAAAAGLLCLAATPGSAQVARPDTALKTQMGDNIVQAQWRGGGFRGGGFRGGWGGGGWRGGYYRGGGWALGGLAAGAIVGGALAAPYYYGGGPYYGSPYYGSSYYDDGYAGAAPVYSGGGDVAYCMQRYRSYDPRSGTFLGNDGFRHPCP